MERFIVFILLSMPIVIISGRTVFNPKSHGFYRFISWECILWLAINNYKFWLKDPLGVNQIFSWFFLFFSLYLVFVGINYLSKVSKSKAERNDKNLYNFESTTELVDTGIYKYIRHPLYSSLLFLTWGIYFKNTEMDLLFVSLLSTLALYLTARFDEKECLEYFGDRYESYMKKSKMFVPYII